MVIRELLLYPGLDDLSLQRIQRSDYLILQGHHYKLTKEICIRLSKRLVSAFPYKNSEGKEVASDHFDVLKGIKKLCQEMSTVSTVIPYSQSI